MYIPDTLLSAHSLSDTDTFSEQLDEEASIMVHTVVQNLSVSSEKLQEIQISTQNDETLHDVKTYLINGWPSNKKDIPLKAQPFWKI